MTMLAPSAAAAASTIAAPMPLLPPVTIRVLPSSSIRSLPPVAVGVTCPPVRRHPDRPLVRCDRPSRPEWTPDRGLRPARRPADRGAGEHRGLDRLAVLPAVRLAGLLRRPARHPRGRRWLLAPVAAASARAAVTAADTLVLETEWRHRDGPRAGHRLHAAARRRRPTSSASCEGISGAVADARRAAAALRLRPHRAVGAARRRGRCTAIAGPGRRLAAHPAPGRSGHEWTHRLASSPCTPASACRSC